MAIRCVVLDFDGTFTDVEEEGRPFVEVYQKDLEDLVGRPIAEAWARHERELASAPGRYGWEHEGRIVAPGNADPYIRSGAIAQMIFSEAGILRDPSLRHALSQLLYQRGYLYTKAAFKPEAKAVLDAITERGLPTFVVTNSRTDVVAEKIDALGVTRRDRIVVFGDAKKYVISEPDAPDPRFSAVPESRRLPGLAERPIYLRRGKYFSVLAKICAQLGIQPAELLVVGDIFELDLALPAELGASIQLVTRPDTAAYEKEAVLSYGERGQLSPSLEAILTRLA